MLHIFGTQRLVLQPTTATYIARQPEVVPPDALLRVASILTGKAGGARFHYQLRQAVECCQGHKATAGQPRAATKSQAF
jgi:hypothetical protein